MTAYNDDGSWEGVSHLRLTAVQPRDLRFNHSRWIRNVLCPNVASFYINPQNLFIFIFSLTTHSNLHRKNFSDKHPSTTIGAATSSQEVPIPPISLESYIRKVFPQELDLLCNLQISKFPLLLTRSMHMIYLFMFLFVTPLRFCPCYFRVYAWNVCANSAILGNT